METEPGNCAQCSNWKCRAFSVVALADQKHWRMKITILTFLKGSPSFAVRFLSFQFWSARIWKWISVRMEMDSNGTASSQDYLFMKSLSYHCRWTGTGAKEDIHKLVQLVSQNGKSFQVHCSTTDSNCWLSGKNLEETKSVILRWVDVIFAPDIDVRTFQAQSNCRTFFLEMSSFQTLGVFSCEVSTAVDG